MRAVTGVPIKFIGSGEKISLETFERFHPDRIADRILGMGDVQSLLERAISEYDEDEAMRLQQKFLDNQFTLQDFLEQLQKIRKMGPISQILGMIPGVSKLQLSGQINNQDVEGRIKRVEAIINSMTADERQSPRILDASRRKRIARGSGTEVRDVNDVIKQHRQMKQLMDQMRKGKLPNIPGLPGGFGL
jgi:signal recognition particle subunit SRP54